MSFDLPSLADVQHTQRVSMKPEPRKRVKGRKQRAQAKIVKSVRAQVVARAESCCERCGEYCGEAGHAHHRVPRSRGGLWTVENILYLCPLCHLAAHLSGAL